MSTTSSPWTSCGLAAFHKMKPLARCRSSTPHHPCHCLARRRTGGRSIGARSSPRCPEILAPGTCRARSCHCAAFPAETCARDTRDAQFAAAAQFPVEVDRVSIRCPKLGVRSALRTWSFCSRARRSLATILSSSAFWLSGPSSLLAPLRLVSTRPLSGQADCGVRGGCPSCVSSISTRVCSSCTCFSSSRRSFMCSRRAVSTACKDRDRSASTSIDSRRTSSCSLVCNASDPIKLVVTSTTSTCIATSNCLAYIIAMKRSSFLLR